MRERVWGVVSGLVLTVALLPGCTSGEKSRGADAGWVGDWLALPPSAGGDLTVAVIDGGLLDHPVLRGHVIGEWEAEATRGRPRNSHATEMAGLVLGANDGDQARVTRGVLVLDVRVLGEDGSGSPRDIAAGIRWAVARDADFILMSLSVSADDQDFRTAVAEAVAAGVSIVASTANGCSESPSYPAEYPGVIGVTSVSKDFSLAPLAGLRGADIAAPGDQVESPSKNHGFRRVSGTSAAAATAASVIVACVGVQDRDEAGVLRYAEKSGVTAASDGRGTPVLRCLRKEK